MMRSSQCGKQHPIHHTPITPTKADSDATLASVLVMFRLNGPQKAAKLDFFHKIWSLYNKLLKRSRTVHLGRNPGNSSNPWAAKSD
ncbi:unnamed protein product, partial [Notodromas monacha]